MMQRALAHITGTRFVQSYMRVLNRRPLATKCTTSGTLMVGADVARQWLEQRDARRPAAFAWDATRTARLTAFAVAVHAPFLHCYHPFVERSVWPRFDIRSTPLKCALDQVFVAPVFTTVFLSYAALAEGLGGAGVAARLESQLLPLWFDSACVWGPAHLVTFNLPIPVRVLWQDVVRLYFGSRMSLRANAPLETRTPS